MSTLSGRQRRRIKRNIANELVKTEVKRRKLLTRITRDENENNNDVTSDSTDANNTSSCSEMICNITEKECGASNLSIENCGVNDCDRDNNMDDVNIDVPENSCHFTMENVDTEDNISDSTLYKNDAESSSSDGIDENIDSDSNIQGNSSDSDDESDDNISTVSSNSTTVSPVCCYDPEEINATFKSYKGASKLYRGTNISQHEFTIAFLSMFHQHSLTYSCGSDFLKFIKQVLPSPNLVIESPLSLIPQLIDYNNATTMHRCCGYCAQLLRDESTCTMKECVSASLPDSCFIEVHLDKQLQNYFSGDCFVIACSCYIFTCTC